jgi:diguanylate cyclase (GGDEF)-like protein
MHSLRTKIAMLAVWVTVIAVAVATLLSVVFIRNAEHSQSEQLLLLLCETGERNLDYYFNSVEKSLRKVAAYTEKDLDGLETEKFQRHMERVEKYFEEIANKTNGVLTFYYRIDPAVSDTVKGFWYVNLDGTDFTAHEVTDITLYDTEDTSKLVWFTVPKYEGKPIWLPPYITDNLDVNVISYNMPIYWRGQFVGVIGIEIDYSTMAEQVDSIHLYNNGYAFLTDTDGRLIYHSRIDLAQLSEEDMPKTPEGLVSESTFTKYTFNGEEKEAVWLRLSNGMRLYVSVPQEETEGDWRHLVSQILLASSAVLVLCILLAWLFSRKVTKPLQQLTEAARQADAGNYDFTLEYKGRDEVGLLTGTFKRMAEHMKAHINDLNRRANVDALTSVRNRGAFTAYVEEMQKNLQAAPENAEFAVGMFDCNDLKTINDTYGHEKGDIFLKTATRVICKVFQHSPVFRIGGDEFAVILRNDDFRNREELVRKFEEDSTAISAAAENPWEKVSVSMGIAVYDPQTDHCVNDTVRRADKVMYVNKKAQKKEA